MTLWSIWKYSTYNTVFAFFKIKNLKQSKEDSSTNARSVQADLIVNLQLENQRSYRTLSSPSAFIINSDDENVTFILARIEHSCHHTQLCKRMRWEVRHLLSPSSPLWAPAAGKEGTALSASRSQLCPTISALQTGCDKISVRPSPSTDPGLLSDPPQPNHVVSSAFRPSSAESRGGSFHHAQVKTV